MVMSGVGSAIVILDSEIESDLDIEIEPIVVELDILKE